MAKLTFYGRRICRWYVPGKGYIYTWSGQWVGHSYGSARGTERQIKNAAPIADYVSIYEGSSDKIFWNYSGVKAGDLVDDQDWPAKFDYNLTNKNK